MSLFPRFEYPVPEETARVARTIFPKGNLYKQWYDTFGMLFADEDFRVLYPQDGQPALSPVRLSLVHRLQFAEGLSDRQAADAVRTRIDWKYVLGLALTDTGFHYSVLSEFRDRLLGGSIEQQLFEKVLDHLKAQKLLKVRGQQRSDSTQVLGALRSLNRLELVVETMRYAPAWLREVLAVKTLWQVWLQNYTWAEGRSLRWRSEKEGPPASIAIRSPYDLEAHFGKKRGISWFGYQVHFTETCGPELPRLITHVETTQLRFKTSV
jgi:transposase